MPLAGWLSRQGAGAAGQGAGGGGGVRHGGGKGSLPWHPSQAGRDPGHMQQLREFQLHSHLHFCGACDSFLECFSSASGDLSIETHPLPRRVGRWAKMGVCALYRVRSKDHKCLAWRPIDAYIIPMPGLSSIYSLPRVASPLSSLAAASASPTAPPPDRSQEAGLRKDVSVHH